MVTGSVTGQLLDEMARIKGQRDALARRVFEYFGGVAFVEDPKLECDAEVYKMARAIVDAAEAGR